jgi:hypothetical protein
MGKKTPTPKAPVLMISVAGVRVTPKSGWLVKRASYTAVETMKIRRTTATDDIDDEDDYGDDDMDDYGHDDENNTDDDGNDVTPVAHTSSKGRGKHAATDLRIPRRHSVPHNAPDCPPLTTVKETFDVPHVPTIAELTAGISVRHLYANTGTILRCEEPRGVQKLEHAGTHSVVYVHA